MKRRINVLLTFMCLAIMCMPLVVSAKEASTNEDISLYSTFTKDERFYFYLSQYAGVTMRILCTDVSASQSKIIGVDVVNVYSDSGYTDIQVVNKGIYNNGSYAKVEVSYKYLGISHTDTFTMSSP